MRTMDLISGFLRMADQISSLRAGSRSIAFKASFSLATRVDAPFGAASWSREVCSVGIEEGEMYRART